MVDQGKLFGRGGDGAQDDRVTIVGDVDRIVFANQDNGYTVMRFVVPGDRVTAVGSVPGIHEGERLRLTGRWITHAKTADFF